MVRLMGRVDSQVDGNVIGGPSLQREAEILRAIGRASGSRPSSRGLPLQSLSQLTETGGFCPFYLLFAANRPCPCEIAPPHYAQ